MGYDPKAVKRPVNMTLKEDLVRRVKGLTANLSETVEALLAGYVEIEEAKRADLKAQCEQWARWSAALVAQYGSPADEYVDR